MRRGMGAVMIFNFLLLVCERARKVYTQAGYSNAMSNRSYDLCLSFFSKEVCEKAREG